MKKGKLWKISKRLRNYRQWRIGKIWGSAVVVLMLGSLYGTACIQAGDLGGFDVSVSEGENWSLPDNWQEDTSGWEEESNTGNATESGATSSAQNNPAENPDNTDHTASVGRESENIFSSAAESPQPNKQQQNNRGCNVLITIDGEAHTASEWAEIKGLNPGTVWERIRRGWTPEEALLPRLKSRHDRARIKVLMSDTDN